MTLESLGWDEAFAADFQSYSNSGFLPARVIRAHRHACDVFTSSGLLPAACTGKMLHDAKTHAELPVVGDWVVVRMRPTEARMDIHAVLPRRTKFSRRAAGERDKEQVLAANVDTVFLVSSLDDNYNLRRIERYLMLARESGAEPIVVLNKADLHKAPAVAQAEVAAVALGVTVVVLSALENNGLEALEPWLQPGRTVALLGSSGVGKSTLINCLLGEEVQDTGDISIVNHKGRHTTTHRELFVTPSGALVIDTPGMREVQFWQSETASVDDTFTDISQLAQQCRFHDCRHNGEPGCAVLAALNSGELDDARWGSFQKLQLEQAYAARKAEASLESVARSSWKKLTQQAKKYTK